MQPKTKLQKKVVALSALLPAISVSDKALAYEKCYFKYAVRVRKRIYCLECGHTCIDGWTLASTLLGCDCPSCGNHLKMMDGYHPYKRKNMYYSSILHKDGMQVVRMFFATVIYHKNKKREYLTHEVMQHWILPSGRITTLSTKTNSMSLYYDQWCPESTLEIRGNSFRFQNLFNIIPSYITPNRKVLPVLKRNGYTGNFYGWAPHRFFGLILENNQAETLLKTKQIPMLQFIASHKDIISKYWPSIRICIRNRYIIQDPSIWIDMVQTLEFFNMDITSTKYVCPVDLKQSHDIWLNKKVKIENLIKRDELMNRMNREQIVYARQKKKFFGLNFIKGNISIKPLENVTEFFDEGEYLHHCIYRNEYFKKKNSLVLSAKINNVPTETIEVTLKPLAIIQSRGLQNNITPYHNDIVNLLQENIHMIAKCV